MLKDNIDITDELIKEFEPEIVGEIIVKQLCFIAYYCEYHDDDTPRHLSIKTEVNVTAYHFEFKDLNHVHFIYIEQNKLDTFIRNKKLERILS